MRELRAIGRRAVPRSSGPAGAVATMALRLWAKVAHHPVDAIAILAAATASLIIIVNAVLLQSGPHLAPFFANPAPPPPTEARSSVAAQAAPKPAELAPARPAVGQRPVQAVAARRNDPIGDLIGSSVGSPSRVMAVQRVLSEFGFGQIKATGSLDEPTSAAIEKFESEHKLPVTGRLSDRLLAELAAMTGRPVE